MRDSKRYLMFIALFLAVAPLAAVPEPTADDIEANRRKLGELRKHPEQMARLREDAEAFFALPENRRKQIAEVHYELRRESTATQARLQDVLQRYVDWLEGLDEARRQQIAAAPDKPQRLALIQKLREQEWIADQPRAIRAEIEKLQGAPRQALIAKERAAERARRLEWLMAKRFWAELEGEAKGRKTLPTRLGELPTAVQIHVSDYLQKMLLSLDEKEQLAKLEGQWPQYPMKLVELADKHPLALPGPSGPKSLADVPPRIYRELLRDVPKQLLNKKETPNFARVLAKFFKVSEGKWPEFGSELARVAKQRGVVFEHEFLAYNLDCLAAPMQDFMKKKLEPLLDAKETYRLTNAIGKWPDYPQAIQELANHHNLQAPWFTLPRVEDWDRYRLQKKGY